MIGKTFRRTVTTAALGVALMNVSRAGLTVLPESSNTIGVLADGDTYLELGIIGWGPNWQYLGFRGEVSSGENESRLASTAKVAASGATLSVNAVLRKTGPRRIEIALSGATDKDTPLTYLIASLDIPGSRFSKGRAVAFSKDGEGTEIPLPLGRRGLGDAVSRFVLTDNAGAESTFSLEPACSIGSDGAARIILAGELFRADEPFSVVLTAELPQDVTFYPGPEAVPPEPGTEDWYPFTPAEDYAEASEIDLTNWLDAPAGRHGRIVHDGGRLVYDGKPIKLWGLNVCYGSCAPDKALAERRAAFYAKYGINAVRLHKYADGPGWAGIQSAESFAELEPEGLDRLDYFIAKLKERGIYVKLSSTFGVKLGPKDRAAVPYMDEFGTGGNRIATGHGSVFLAPELQDLQIRQIVTLLTHRNPYTGLTYAEDPAVAVVELFNEDSALFFGTQDRLQKIPTLRRKASERFGAWLRARYGTEDALLQAWGPGALNSFGNEGFTDESWEKNTIVPAGNPWFYDPDQLAGSQKPKAGRLRDTMLFLYEIQNEFYDRYVKAIRDAGYDGEILGSNWQAGRAFSHYYNLHSDYRVGLIDRHNYFGGGDGAKIDSVSMLRVPGSGMLSAGMQQVADRPFMLSEWIHVTPNEWGAEGPAIIGAYGMGLQGWDVSYMFQNRDSGGFSDRIGRDRWDVTAPQVLGLFPAVSRQVLRNDVREAEIAATRYVHMPSLHEGKLGFEDRVSQQWDVKTFDSDKVPVATLAVARSVVEFSDEYRDTPAFDIAPFRDGDACVSATGELRWTPGKAKHDGFFTIDTPATRAVVGFARGRTCNLGTVTIAPASRFAAVYVTARDADSDVDTGKAILVVAVARARNTGMTVLDDSRVLAKGEPPIVLEPVKATLSLRRPGTPVVRLLDHDGRRTDKTLPVTDGSFTIDGAADRTPYYLIEYP